jgi:1,4-dihydroxy-2-naphthoate octaprenyltransferase
MTTSTVHERSKFSLWLQAVRTFSAPASVVPVLVGTTLSLFYSDKVDWFLFPIVLICGVIVHFGSNLVCEYYDYKTGVDREYTYGSSRVLVEHLMKPKQVLKGGLIFLLVGMTLGLILVYMRGYPMLLLGLVGVLGGYLYSAPPFSYKYHAFGDVMIFLLFGPLMVIGTYFSLTGSYMHELWLMAIPVGCLVCSILQANNHRDITHDTEAGIKTVSSVIGHKASKVEYFIIVLGSYVSVLTMVIFELIPIYTLIVFSALPIAIKNLKDMKNSLLPKFSEIAILDVFSAQHHMMFGVLYSVGFILSYILK